jgi:hypothetical protein
MAAAHRGHGRSGRDTEVTNCIKNVGNEARLSGSGDSLSRALRAR